MLRFPQAKPGPDTAQRGNGRADESSLQPGNQSGSKPIRAIFCGTSSRLSHNRCEGGGHRSAIINDRKEQGRKGVQGLHLKHHTLEGVITCNTDTFYGVGTNPVIAVFTAGEPHDPDKESRFIDFRDDGYEVRAHVGLVEGDSAKDKKQHLLDVWNDREEAPSKFCVSSTVKADDEWLHSFYYFNDEIPTEEDFEKAIADYLTFQLDMISHGRSYLFEEGPNA